MQPIALANRPLLPRMPCRWNVPTRIVFLEALISMQHWHRFQFMLNPRGGTTDLAIGHRQARRLLYGLKFTLQVQAKWGPYFANWHG
jgi:hypothetical protein